jgi:hypothetical protein
MVLSTVLSALCSTGVATMRLVEVSGAARHLQKVLLQIDTRYYIAVICIFG